MPDLDFAALRDRWETDALALAVEHYETDTEEAFAARREAAFERFLREVAALAAEAGADLVDGQAKSEPSGWEELAHEPYEDGESTALTIASDGLRALAAQWRAPERDGRELTAAAILEAEGHTVGSGWCEKCWRTAASMYAMGQGPHESHTDAYYRAMREAEDRAIARAGGEEVPDGW